VTETPERVVKRVLANVVMGPGQCHVSRYAAGSHGYAQVGWSDGGVRGGTLCHLVIWRWFRGPIPEDMTVDHTCKNRKCVRLMHLRLIPNLENARRTDGRDWEIGRCVRGHPDAKYWRPKGPGRVKGYCAACAAENQDAFERRHPGRRAATKARYKARKRAEKKQARVA